MMLDALVLTVALGQGGQPGAVMRVWQTDRPLSQLAPLVPGQSPNAWLRIDEIDLVDDDFGPFKDDFMVLIDANLQTESAGKWTFRLTSDDGSQLWISGRQVIDNDGLHGAESVEGTIDLAKGTHPMQVKFFEQGVSALLRLEWKAPGATDFEVIPARSMRSTWPDQRPIHRSG